MKEPLGRPRQNVDNNIRTDPKHGTNGFIWLKIEAPFDYSIKILVSHNKITYYSVINLKLSSFTL